MTGDDAARRPTPYEIAVSQGRGWQYDGPTLRNSEKLPADPYHWGVIETLIWIVTRDFASVEGGLFWAQYGGASRIKAVHGEDRALGAFARLVINDLLTQDTAGHARNCPSSSDSGSCSCDQMGRVRFCRCPDRFTSWELTCTCVTSAIAALLAAMHEGMPFFGRRDGEREDVEVPRAALAGLAISYAPDGVRLLDNFSRIRIPIVEIKTRWPEKFFEKEAVPSSLSPQAATLARLDGVVLPGRPADWLWGLKVFCDHLDAGTVARDRLAEAGNIAPVLVKKEGRSKEATAKTIAGWIAKYHDEIRWVDGRMANAPEVASKVVSTIAEKVDDKLKVRRGTINQP